MRYRKIPCKTMIILFLLVVAAFDAAAAELPITSPFGWRVHPITGAWRFHTGIDLGYDYGTPIPAMFDGIVLAAGDFGDGYGNQVVLYHPAYDTYTRYAHMQSISVAVLRAARGDPRFRRLNWQRDRTASALGVHRPRSGWRLHLYRSHRVMAINEEVKP